ncbi:hypothetical protein BU14_0396s0010 [Porphyra umbilicalis]|uniref:Nudix hydrolase domain-containing protein n=1 Tax=Porphyra umbilicalis TaxID=2786 RepID=A0A1X6NWD5_PORUM|nr:hypothetical protein BU14_0396s0010 [Porphyra umbilicalis]|eukprot:OSX72907.1 hypothetical protein BU14_0396s0010 [Porphyra umbilicalis]
MGRQTVGCVPVLVDAATGTPSVLLVRPLSPAAVWRFPASPVGSGERSRKAASRGALAQAGVKGEVVGPTLGSPVALTAPGNRKVWLLHVTDVHDRWSKGWKGRNKWERRWLTFPDARALLKREEPSKHRAKVLELLNDAATRLVYQRAAAAAAVAAAAAAATATVHAPPPVACDWSTELDVDSDESEAEA